MAYEEMSGAKILIQALVDQGVTDVFGYPGGAILPVYDELFQQNRIRHILVRQERRRARSRGLRALDGPGGSMDRYVRARRHQRRHRHHRCVDGQRAAGDLLRPGADTHLIGNDAFQECDTTGITRPCTKHNYLVKSTADLARTIHEAFYVARSGRPGPVLDRSAEGCIAGHGPVHPTRAHRAQDLSAENACRPPPDQRGGDDDGRCQRPILLRRRRYQPGPRASELLTRLVDMTGFPVTLTLMGLGAVPASHPKFLGMLGMHGTYEANLTMHGCDVMVCIGARFDDRVTGRLNAFAPNAKKIHIDIDPSSINKNVLVDLGIVGDVTDVLNQIIEVWDTNSASPDRDALAAWWRQIEQWRARNSLAYRQTGPSSSHSTRSSGSTS